MQKKRVYLDSAEMRGRLRSYTPRPVVRTTRQPQKITDIKSSQNINISQQSIDIYKYKTQSYTSVDENTNNRQSLALASNINNEDTFITNIHNNAAHSIVNETAKKHKINGFIRSFKQNKLAYCLSITAFLLLILGVGVNVSGLITNHKVEQQIAKASAQNKQSNGENNQNGPSGVDETPVSESVIKSYNVAPDMPRYLNINKISVHARVKRVGTDKDGAVGTTASVWDVGWYEGSSKPGEIGAAFIVGHVSGPIKGGIFYNLKKLKEGDIISIEKGNGEVINYKVVAKEEVNKNDVNMRKALSSIDPSKQGLNLMTCAGKYDSKQETFNNRLIVYSVRI